MLAYLRLIQKEKSSFKQSRRSTSAGTNVRFRKSITGARRRTTVLLACMNKWSKLLRGTSVAIVHGRTNTSASEYPRIHFESNFNIGLSRHLQARRSCCALQREDWPRHCTSSPSRAPLQPSTLLQMDHGR